MARLWTSGFELQSVAADVEITNTAGTAPTISTTTLRSGAAALRCNPTTATSGAFYQFVSADNTGNFYLRAYINISSLPTSIVTSVTNANSDITIMELQNASGSWCELTLDASGVVRVYQDGTTRSVVGTSSALSTNTWYMLELGYGSANSYVEAKIDGVSIGSTSSATGLGGVTKFGLGVALTAGETASANIFFDDVAINDATGGSQNTFAGSGKVIRLKPNATGDANTFSTQTGGTAGGANNFTRVNEVTPNDATSFNGSTTLNEHDLFNVDASAIGATDTVNVVQVNGRFRDSTADATQTIKFEIEKAAAGTILQSSAIIPNTTTWVTNSVNAPHNPVLTTYTNPDGAAWTQTTLDSMQIGYKLTVDGSGTRRIDVTSVYATVDYTPVTLSSSLSVSDSTTLSESKSVTIDDNTNKSDSVTLSENLILDIAENINKSDTVTITEFKSLALAQDLVTSDSSTLSESQTHYSDQVDTNERVIIFSELNINKSDTATITESLILSNEKNINKSESVTVTENKAANFDSNITTFDSTTLSESLTLSENTGQPIAPSETISTSENVSLFVLESLNTSDSTTISESLTMDLNNRLPLSVSDTITLSEAITAGQNFPNTIAENITVRESLSHYSDQVDVFERAIVSVSADKDVSVSDSTTLSESLAATLAYGINASDSLTVSEFHDQDVGGGRNISIVDNRLQDETGDFLLDENGNYITSEDPGDVVLASESVSLLVYTDKAVTKSESVSVSESVGAQTDIPLSMSQAVTVSEGLDNGGVPNPSSSDTITYSEITQLQITTFTPTITSLDSIAVSDSASNDGAPNPSVSDSTTLGEVISLQVVSTGELGSFDSVAITESVSLSGVPNPNISDSISTSETISVRPEVNLGDTQQSFDAVAVSESVRIDASDLPPQTISDTATITESVSGLVSVATTKSDSLTVSESTKLLVESSISTSDNITPSESVSLLNEDNDSIAENVIVTESVSLEALYVASITQNISVTQSSIVTIVYPDLEINKIENISIIELLSMKRTKHKQPKINDIQVDQDETAVYLGQDNASGIYLGQN
jgi:hypothetical protein